MGVVVVEIGGVVGERWVGVVMGELIRCVGRFTGRVNEMGGRRH